MKEIHVKKVAKDRYQVRGLPVVNCVVRHGKKTPVIRFGGNYLNLFGWQIGTRFELTVTDNKILIEKR